MFDKSSAVLHISLCHSFKYCPGSHLQQPTWGQPHIVSDCWIMLISTNHILSTILFRLRLAFCHHYVLPLFFSLLLSWSLPPFSSTKLLLPLSNWFTTAALPTRRYNYIHLPACCPPTWETPCSWGPPWCHSLPPPLPYSHSTTINSAQTSSGHGFSLHRLQPVIQHRLHVPAASPDAPAASSSTTLPEPNLSASAAYIHNLPPSTPPSHHTTQQLPLPHCPNHLLSLLRSTSKSCSKTSTSQSFPDLRPLSRFLPGFPCMTQSPFIPKPTVLPQPDAIQSDNLIRSYWRPPLLKPVHLVHIGLAMTRFSIQIVCSSYTSPNTFLWQCIFMTNWTPKITNCLAKCQNCRSRVNNFRPQMYIKKKHSEILEGLIYY